MQEIGFLKKKQNHSWSAEDERMLSGLISIVEGWHNTTSEEEKEYYGDCGYINWLNSLKDRVQPQPKQEWSEEDSKIAKELIRYLPYCDDISKDTKEKWISWLKTLKPQQNLYDKGYNDGYSAAKYNHWKPSEEQMQAIKFCCANFEEYDALQSLYNDLKKL